jgi:hypothetical protein
MENGSKGLLEKYQQGFEEYNELHKKDE